MLDETVRSRRGRRSATRSTPVWRRRALHTLVILTMTGGTAGFALAATDLDDSSADPLARAAVVPVERHGDGTLDTASRFESREDATVEIVVDGESQQVPHAPGTVAELLADAGIVVGEQDEVSVPMASVARPGTRIEVTTAREEHVQEREVAEYETVEEDDPSMPRGERRVEQAGKDGERSATYLISYRGGDEVDRVLVADATIGEPVDKIVRVGTADPTPEPEPAPAASEETTQDESPQDESPEETGSTSATPSAPAPSGGNPRAIGERLAADRGWGGEQFSCLDRLWERESGWDPSAQNPSSGAYGIPQSLPGSKMASTGADWRTNPATQITWGLDYIAGRYGTPCSAWAHSERMNWY